jgi:hypothetical protein
MGKPKHNYTLRFVERSSGRPAMPILVTEPSGTRVGTTGSYNSFENKDEVNRFLHAQRTIAKHFSLDKRFEEHIKGFDLIREVVYTSKLELI